MMGRKIHSKFAKNRKSLSTSNKITFKCAKINEIRTRGLNGGHEGGG